MGYGPVASPSFLTPTVPHGYRGDGKPDLYWAWPRTFRRPPRPPRFKLWAKLQGVEYVWRQRAADLVERSRFGTTTRLWGMFEGPGGAILGAHVWIQLRADQVVRVDVLFSNGAVDPEEQEAGFCGAVFFEELGFEAEGFMVGFSRPNETIGLRRWSLHGQHYFAPGVQFVRRFALALDIDAADRALRLHGLEIPDPFPRYTASKASMPTDPSTPSTAQFETTLAAGGANDTLDLRSPPLGPWHGLGNTTNPYEHGGQGIEPSPGRWCSAQGALYGRFLSDAAIERTPLACFHKKTGLPITDRDWKGGANVVPWEHRLERTRFHKLSEIPAFMQPRQYDWYPGFKQFNGNNGCPYRGAIERVVAPDDAHMCRVTAPMKRAWWLARDHVAAFVMRMMAEDSGWSWTLHGRPEEWGWHPQSLTKHIEINTAKPGHGGWYGRGPAWTLDLWCNMRASGYWDSAWQMRFSEYARMLSMAATPAGFVHSANNDSFSGYPAHDGAPTSSEYTQFFETCFQGFAQGEACMMDRRVRGYLEPLIYKTAREMYDNPDVPVPLKWIETKDNGVPLAHSVRRWGPKDYWWPDCLLAMAARLSGDRSYLDFVRAYSTNRQAHADAMRGNAALMWGAEYVAEVG
jgi:hypothetical protein